MSLEEIFEQVQQDPSTHVDPEWMDHWLANLGDKQEEYHYLQNKTLESVQQEKEDVLREHVQQEKWTKSLSMYRVLNDLQDLRLGSHIRWIREKTPGVFLLTNGGILVQTKFLSKGTYVVCKNGKQMMQYELNKCKTFQRITPEEWVILSINQ